MVRSVRGLPTIVELCEKHGAHRGFRLRGEYVPSTAPFPDSPEETAWLERRESLVVSVLGAHSGWIVLSSWTVGGKETVERADLAPDELDPWAVLFEERGGWTLADLAPIPTGPEGEGVLEFEHDAYEYHDSDPDSLDLDAWSAPRHQHIERRTGGTAGDAAGALLGVYRRFLPGPLLAASPFAAVFPA